jgi:hypothetical protein
MRPGIHLTDNDIKEILDVLCHREPEILFSDEKNGRKIFFANYKIGFTKMSFLFDDYGFLYDIFFLNIPKFYEMKKELELLFHDKLFKKIRLNLVL